MPRPPRTTAAREALSPARIAAAALALIDEQGLERFSMRALGTRLGVEAMAIYHHFPSKGAVLDAVMDALLLEWRWPDEGEPLQRLAASVRAYRGLALAHPRAFPLLVGRRFNSAGAFEAYERLLQAFAAAGLGPAATARWFRLLGYFVNGAGMADIASREQEPDATPVRLQHAPQDLPWPHVAAVAPFLKVDRLDEVFEFGLQVLLQTLAAGAGPAGPAPAPRRKRPERRP